MCKAFQRKIQKLDMQRYFGTTFGQLATSLQFTNPLLSVSTFKKTRSRGTTQLDMGTIMWTAGVGCLTLSTTGMNDNANQMLWVVTSYIDDKIHTPVFMYGHKSSLM